MQDTVQTHGSPAVGKRVLGRTAAALWHQKVGIVAGLLIVGALGAYSTLAAPVQAPTRDAAAASLTAGDCADATISALVDRSPASMQQAYQCMDPSYQQRVSQQQFSTQIKAATGGPAVTRVQRVGTYEQPNGSELVYYALDSGNGQTVGYIVYLGSSGKVLKIE
jgi:hypothetical protein